MDYQSYGEDSVNKENISNYRNDGLYSRISKRMVQSDGTAKSKIYYSNTNNLFL